MSAVRLTDNAVSVRRFDVVGHDAETVPHFVRHVALSTEEQQEHHPMASLPLTHMIPPLAIGEEHGPINMVGSVPLTVGETLQISLFVDELRLEYEANSTGILAQYCIRPYTMPRQRRNGDLTVQSRRFSCVGFVIEAYRDAGIDLVVTDEERLPMVALETVCAAYPEQAQQLQNQQLRSRLRLNGDGPWPIVLAGYVLNALNRPEAEIRAGAYLPQPGDEYFPSHHQSITESDAG